ncbi:GYD domain-containing protein [Palleronia sp. KMU-117]|uniref:GYD domain-containing protein n=1 Tax=Palleronia sp. KMU-117 TaxID=3434108 RepID=UPI003D75E9AF
MPRHIITGCYTASAMKGMMAHPSDRGAAAAKIAAAGGGTLEQYYVTTGPSDFLMVVSTDSPDIDGLMAALMVAGGSGAITNIQTVRALTTDEFTAIQKKAGQIASAYAAPA